MLFKSLVEIKIKIERRLLCIVFYDDDCIFQETPKRIIVGEKTKTPIRTIIVQPAEKKKMYKTIKVIFKITIINTI